MGISLEATHLNRPAYTCSNTYSSWVEFVCISTNQQMM